MEQKESINHLQNTLVVTSDEQEVRAERSLFPGSDAILEQASFAFVSVEANGRLSHFTFKGFPESPKALRSDREGNDGWVIKRIRITQDNVGSLSATFQPFPTRDR